MTTDPLEEAAEALRQAQDACRAAWDACERAIQDVVAAQRLVDGSDGDEVDRQRRVALLPRMVDDSPTVERAADAQVWSASAGRACEECDLIDGHTIWCSKRWGAD